MKYKIALLPGDGVGKEISKECIKVIRAIEKKYDIEVEIVNGHIGGEAIDLFGDPYPEQTKKVCESSDAILFGSVGGPKWEGNVQDKRPEKAILNLRKDFNLFANIRPIKVYDMLADSSKIKNVDETDMVIVRELTSGIYFGNKKTEEEYSEDIMHYSIEEIERISRVAFETAMKRRKKVSCIDKSNVLETSKLWRKVVKKVSKDYPEVELDFMYVDNCAMQIILNPQQFDVILTSNMFGDIISDEASTIVGSIGMAPSASLGKGKFGLYEPIHGSAPDIAGKNIVNPIGAILSLAMMFKYSFDKEDISNAIENAVERIINKGYRTKDIQKEGETAISTDEMGDLIAKEI